MSVNAEKLRVALEYHQSGMIEEAELLYKEVIADEPENDMAQYFLGIFAYERNEIDKAIAFISKAARLNPEANYYKDLGEIFLNIGEPDKAIENYKISITLAPDDTNSFFNLGMAYFNKKEFNETIKYFKLALELNPQDAVIYNKLGAVYRYNKEYNEAIKCYNKAIEIFPDFDEAYLGLGILFQGLEKSDEAIYYYEKSLQLKPDYSAYFNLALSYYAKCEIDQAIRCCINSIELNNEFIDAHIFLGVAYMDLGNIDEAEKCYNKALEIDPDSHEVIHSLSSVYLKRKQFEKGWECNEHRFFTKTGVVHKLLTLDKPKWDGSSLEHKSIYVYYECGFGDTIHFIRYLPLLKEMGAKKVIFKAYPELKKLFEQSDLKADLIVDTSVPDSSLDFDYQMPIISLPYAFKTTDETIPFKDGYLKADPEKVKLFRQKYFDTDDFKIGIVWHCNYILFKDRNRRIPHIKTLYPIARLAGTKIYSLQKGPATKQLKEMPDDVKIINLGDELGDFSDTAAAIKNLDLLITVDTSVMHLAGALASPAWCLMSRFSDWKLGCDDTELHWYNSVKIFRQEEPENWDEVIDRVVYALKEKLKDRAMVTGQASPNSLRHAELVSASHDLAILKQVQDDDSTA